MGHGLESGNGEIVELDIGGLENVITDGRFEENGNVWEGFEDCSLGDAKEARSADMERDGRSGFWEAGDELVEAGNGETEMPGSEDDFQDCMLWGEEGGKLEGNDGFEIEEESEFIRYETETLMPFKQGQWERMSVEEQKASLEQLTEYNAKVLDIENPPAIIYYENMDLSDCGAYSESENVIMINERNMGDGIETADTISHESRHCYQYERAKKLENERDLAFREGLEQYVRPEDDYAGYKNQLVERDARAYADVVKGKIASLEKWENK